MTAAFQEHRPRLFGLAYRMLGSVSEAEDAVQETYLRWRRQDPASVDSPAAWLVTALTRLCIDQLRSARRHREEYYGVWLPEPLVESPAPSPAESAALADSLSMAFMLMLERLAPPERAVFLLREIFDYDYAAIARIVGKSEAGCRQIVHRAKASLRPAPEPAAPPDARARAIVRKFLAATTTGEVGDLLQLLTDDATLYTDGGGRVRAAGRPIESADHVSRFFVGIRRRYADVERRHRLVMVNGRLGAVVLTAGRLENVLAFELEGDRVRTIYLVRNPDKLRHLAPLSRPNRFDS
ncbi:MAG: RNA polymerase sigma-70 factor [Verrucomicrobia bacterium]|nr:RNA polymerase sigma-70 factor [Verrucomicrobiota bacterium]